MRTIIPKGQTYHALWDGKEQDMMAESDRVTLPLGSYQQLQECCDKKWAEVPQGK